MTKTEEYLVIGLYQVENLLKLSEKLEYTDYIQSKLYKLKYEFERQLKLCPSTLDKPN